MKSITTLLSVIALGLSSSALAGDMATDVSVEEQLATIENKLALSCFNNRQGDREYIGAAETVRLCRNAARRAVANVTEAQKMEIAAVAQSTDTKVN